MRPGLLTTNNLPEPEKVEPKKLNQITTEIIPAAPKDPPEPKGDGFKKMITTHDEPKPETVVLEPKTFGEMKMDAVPDIPGIIRKPAVDTPQPEAKKKPAKKAK